MENLAATLQPYKDTVGAIAGVVTIAQFFSGAVMCKDIYNSKSTTGVPSMPFIGGIVIGILMLKYSLILNDTAMLVVNLAAVILNVLYTAFYLIYSQDKVVEIFKPLSYGVALIACLFGYTSWEKEELIEERYGLIVTILLLVLIGSPLLELKEIVRTKDASCIPFPITFMGTICSSLWLLYGIILLNNFMIVQNVVGLTLCFVQLMLCFMYPKRKEDEKKIRNNKFSLSSYLKGSAARAETTTTTQGLNKLQAQELILRLNSEERTLLYTALQEYQSKLVKDEYQGQLAASRWRSKFGRPSKLPRLGDVDPTGSYCLLPEDWLMKKCVESVPPPSMNNLINIGIANAIPFIGFGFLDNFFMIIFGDHIDIYLGSYFCLSTMAAAALGNTFSDVLGLGSAFYVERLANRIGFNPPKLSPIQMEMPISRYSANAGRVIGVIVGCLLGMVPLLFTKSKKEEHSAVVAPVQTL
ncbi:hypothetical protein FQA39_LY05939 [Lamprigera yunnana]|nr:hypothetical protein FQA39_LY05939 [Lamprigera yunnana]